MMRTVGWTIFLIACIWLIAILQYAVHYIEQPLIEYPASIPVSEQGEAITVAFTGAIYLDDTRTTTTFAQVPQLASVDIAFGVLATVPPSSTEQSSRAMLEEVGFDVTPYASDDMRYAQVKSVRGKKVGFLSISDKRRDLWTGDSLERLIQQEKSAVDYLVVSVEWGATNTAVSDRQREIATRSIVSGADAVVGYGPHVVQDDSTINGKPVLYSLGDFVGSRTYRGVAPVSMVAVLTFNPRGSITVDRFASDKDALKAPGALRPFQERDAVVRLEPKQKFTCPVPTGKSISLRFVSFPRTEPIAAYTPPDLVVIPSSYTEGANVCATAKAYEAFVSLHDAMEDAGLDLSVTYGFRDTDSQEALIASFAQQGKKSFVAPVGQSEHVLGTAFDFASGSTNFFGSSPEYTFLKEHGHEFGFVQSYQGDPQDETHIPREPWHWRYVGTGIATALKKSGLPINLFLKSY